MLILSVYKYISYTNKFDIIKIINLSHTKNSQVHIFIKIDST